MKNILFISFLLVNAASGTPLFSFDGVGGSLTGVAGGTVGWGFTLSDSTEFLVIAETGFCPVTAVQSDLPGPCSAAFLAVGNYVDFASDIPVVGPVPDTTPLTENFNVALTEGFGKFSIASNASLGTTNGEIAIIYDLFTGDPTTDPNASQIGGDNFFTLPASITVQSGVPEPGGLILIGLGLAGIAMKRLFPRERPAERSDRDL